MWQGLKAIGLVSALWGGNSSTRAVGCERSKPRTLSFHQEAVSHHGFFLRPDPSCSYPLSFVVVVGLEDKNQTVYLEIRCHV